MLIYSDVMAHLESQAAPLDRSIHQGTGYESLDGHGDCEFQEVSANDGSTVRAVYQVIVGIGGGIDEAEERQWYRGG